MTCLKNKELLIMKSYKKTTIITNKEKYGSYFDGSLSHHLLVDIKVFAISLFSLGFAYPWALCMKHRTNTAIHIFAVNVKNL